MRMELIQPFINAADAVFSDLLQSSAKIIYIYMYLVLYGMIVV
jgi:hypothetical protein